MQEQGRQSTVRQWIEYLHPDREKLSCFVLHAICRFFKEEKEEEHAAEYLALAVCRAGRTGEYEACGRYGLELVMYLEEHHGIARGLEEAEKIEKILNHKNYSGWFQIHRKILEYHLQMGDRMWMEQFAGKVPERNRKLQAVMERRAVIWALSLAERKEEWGNTPAESRMYGRISPVFMEYGFFSYGWFLYLNRDAGYGDVLKEGLCAGGNSIFSQWMRLLLYLDRYKTQKNEQHRWKEAICRLEREIQKQRVEYPAFLEEDEMLLAGILMDGVGETQGGPQREEDEMGEEPVLKVFCLGSFSVQSGDEMLSWRTKKAKELFACLFSQEGKGLDKNGLIFRLWPEATEKNGSTLFNTTVSYLRRTLMQVGMADILVVKDRLYSLDMEKIWSDMGRLEELAKLIKEERFEDVDNPQELLTLYCGEYFGSEDYRWMVGQKEYAEQLFIRSAKRLAVYEAGRKRYDTAVLILQKVLEVAGGSSECLHLLMTYRLEDFIRGYEGEECSQKV